MPFFNMLLLQRSRHPLWALRQQISIELISNECNKQVMSIMLTELYDVRASKGAAR